MKLLLKNLHIVKEASVVRTNGTVLGTIKFDKTWENFRFYPDKCSFDIYDMKDITALLKSMKV